MRSTDGRRRVDRRATRSRWIISRNHGRKNLGVEASLASVSTAAEHAGEDTRTTSEHKHSRTDVGLRSQSTNQSLGFREGQRSSVIPRDGNIGMQTKLV